MSDDGSMARLPELINFSKKHSLKIGTVSDLIKYRLKNKTIIKLISERKFEREMGKDFQLKKWNVETIETDKRTIKHLKIIGINSSSKFNSKIQAFEN